MTTAEEDRISGERLSEAKQLWADTLKHLDDHREQEIYERLTELVVPLELDPLLFGPKNLSEKVFHCRKCLIACEQIWLGASQRQHAAYQDHLGKKAAFELSKKYLFALDPLVRAERTGADREALATIRLRDEMQGVLLAEQVLLELDSVLIVVKAKRADLKNTQSALNNQMKLCNARLDAGEKWGSAVPGAAAFEVGRRVVADETDIYALISSVEREVQLPDEPDEPEVIEEHDESVLIEEPPEPTESPMPLVAVAKGVFADLEIPDSDLDGIDWLDALDDQDTKGGPQKKTPTTPKPVVVKKVEAPTPKPPTPKVTETPVDLSVDLPQGTGAGEFTFEEESFADFDKVVDQVEAPQTTRTRAAGVSVVTDEDTDALLELFGD